MDSNYPIHPLRTKARILLASVFGPYAQDDEYGSRQIKPMELYHNQVTRVQGAFSLRMFHRSFGLLLIQANLDAPVTVLDFPTRDRFIAELRERHYDVIGISSIMPNIDKAAEMCRLIRQYQPQARIVIGGHVTNYEHVESRLNADYFVRGEGVGWFRRYLGQDPAAPIRHPEIYSGFGTRIMGMNIGDKAGDTAAILLPSVGCPLGCNFCSTSALFGGKGKSIHFYKTGDELFAVMCRLEEKLKVSSFFALDENFLFYRERALRLLELMREHGKSWSLYIFSSVRGLKSYSIDQLLGLGVSWVWTGLEGKDSQYAKLGDTDSRQLVAELQSHGIRVLGSSIIGMENHTPENIDEVIDYAVSHRTVFHQFMLYTPVSGTPLYQEMQAKGQMLPETEIGHADVHGQYRFNFRHRFIRHGEEQQFLLDAFQRDYEVNGPSIARLFRVTMNGYFQHGNHPERRIRERVRREAAELRGSYAGAVWAIRRRYSPGSRVWNELDVLQQDIYRAFGWKTRLLAPVLGLIIGFFIRREERRLAAGQTYEPATFYEKNSAALALELSGKNSVPDVAMELCPAALPRVQPAK